MQASVIVSLVLMKMLIETFTSKQVYFWLILFNAIYILSECGLESVYTNIYIYLYMYI